MRMKKRLERASSEQVADFLEQHLFARLGGRLFNLGLLETLHEVVVGAHDQEDDEGDDQEVQHRLK